MTSQKRTASDSPPTKKLLTRGADGLLTLWTCMLSHSATPLAPREERNNANGEFYGVLSATLHMRNIVSILRHTVNNRPVEN